MQYMPTFEQVRGFAREGCDIVPVSMELLADTCTPVNLFLSLKGSAQDAFLLESAESGEQCGRYSFIGCGARMQIIARGEQLTIVENGQSAQRYCANPLDAIAALMQSRRSPKIQSLPKLTGGLVGYFGYDTLRYAEPTLLHVPPDDLHLPDIHLMMYDEIIAFDHLKHKITLIVNMPAHRDGEQLALEYRKAGQRLQTLRQSVQQAMQAPPAPRAKAQTEPTLRANMTQGQFEQNVRRAKEYIHEGEAFQIVLSQRFEVAQAPDAFDVYRMLRVSNPSPYMYYFQCSDYKIAGASPEMLVSVDGCRVAARPIAGTIRRGADEAEDLALENQLISDAKELSEHTMLVDLGRNDVGRVSEIGSVEVPRFMAVEKYSQLMHLVSDVRGTLRGGCDSTDALLAVMPAGTLSGAPKIRAMQIIDELEPNKRGLYGGAIGYIGFDGDMDTCIAIRTVLFKGDMAYIQAGAGIVADSEPEKEYLETQTKAKAMIKAILEANEL